MTESVAVGFRAGWGLGFGGIGATGGVGRDSGTVLYVPTVVVGYTE